MTTAREARTFGRVPHARPRILLTVLAAAAFLPFLGQRDIVTSHEARVVQTAREMAHAGWPWQATPSPVPSVKLGRIQGESGTLLRLLPDPAAAPLHVNPWFVPVLNGEMRLQKPPLPYWCAAALFRLAGQWSEGLARLIPALLGACSTILIYDLARLLVGRRAATPAALVWVTTLFVPDEFRKVMADPYLAFFALLAIWAWIRSTLRPSRSAIIAFYIATALGLLAKGPPLLIHLGGALIVFHVLYRRRPTGPISAHLLGLVILVAIALPWPLYVLNHVPHALDIWRFESIGEISDNTENARPAWYYLPQVALTTLPWTLVWIYALVVLVEKFRVRRSSPRRFFPTAWFATIVLIFSLINLKKNAYLLPAMPAQTLMIAQGLARLTAHLRRRGHSRRRLDETFALLCTLLVIGLAAFFVFVRTPTDNNRSPRPASAFIALALKAKPAEYTVLPAKLPPEAALYLPIDLDFNPAAPAILYLVDDPKGQSPTDLSSFQERLPHLNIQAAAPIPIPNDTPKHRYKLFALTRAPGAAKALAQN